MLGKSMRYGGRMMMKKGRHYHYRTTTHLSLWKTPKTTTTKRSINDITFQQSKNHYYCTSFIVVPTKRISQVCYLSSSSSYEDEEELPPEFSIIDNNDDNNDFVVSETPTTMPETVANSDDDNDDDGDFYDDYNEWKSSSTKTTTTMNHQYPIRSRRNDDSQTTRSYSSSSSSLSSSSWMEKNNRFESRPNDYNISSDNKSNNKNNKNKNDKKNKSKNYQPREEEDGRQPRYIKQQQQQQGNDSFSKNSFTREFRNNFRGTRVFVQGIPNHIQWQQLKDHFRIAGDVVFASISMDKTTGQSKGCGIVQYETSEMAKNAIQIMREYPLDDATLYVREDRQEENDQKHLSSSSSGRRRQQPFASGWNCADEDNASSLLSSERRSEIMNLIKKRDVARRKRDYDTSDSIREELKYDYGIHLDDRLKLWWNSVDGNNVSGSVPQTILDIKGENGRWDRQNQNQNQQEQEPWRQIPTTPENDACVDSNLVFALLQQRDIARKEKDFETADRLLKEARDSPNGGGDGNNDDLFLRIHDESRTWRIWTSEPPPKPVRHAITKYENDYNNNNDDDDDDYNGGDDDMPKRKKMTMMSPEEQCIELVLKFDPDKLNEIQTVLKKFPGREYNILKKLKQRYLKP